MSRSYKKIPFCKANVSKFEKRQASKRARRSNEWVDGASYKKVSPSYDICDYKLYTPYRENATYTKEEWLRWCIRK